MKDTTKTSLFETMPIPRAVASLSIPTVLSSLVMVLYSLADTYFVGMLGDAVQNAAVTLAAPVLLAFNAVNNLFGVGSSSMMSRALGRKDPDTVRRSSAFGFYCALLSGILFSLLVAVFRLPLLKLLGADASTMDATGGYLFWTTILGAVPAILNVVMAYLVRSEGASLHASLGTMSGCLCNILLDPFFILPWGLDMGAAGAGCATFLSNALACCYFFIHLFCKRRKTYVCISPKLFCLKRNIVTGVCAVGIPAAIQNLLNVTGMTVLNNFTAAYGTQPVAAMGIAYKVFMIPLQVTFGISQGIMPLISYNFASGNIKRMKKALFFTTGVSVCFMALVSLSYFLGAGGLISLFMKDSAIIDYGSSFLRAMSLALVFQCVDFIAVGVFQACGMGKKSLVFAVLRKIVLEIPALFLLNLLFPLYGLAYSHLAAESILACAAVIVLFRLFRSLERDPLSRENS